LSRTGPSLSKFVRGSALLFVGQLVSISVKFITQILIVRHLTKAEYGAFAYALTIVELGVILALVSLENAARRFIPIYDEEKDYASLFGLMVLSLLTITGLAVLLVLVVVLAQDYMLGTVVSDPLSISLLIVLITLLPLQALDQWIEAVFASFSSVRSIFVRRYLLLPGLQLLTIFIVVAADLDVYWLAAGYLLIGAVGTTLYGWMLVSLFRKKGLWKHFSWKKLRLRPRATFGFSLPLFVTGLVYIGRSQLIIVILELFHGTTAVAEFRVVQPAVRLNSLVYASFEFMYLPIVARLFAKNDGQGISEAYWRTAAWISIATFPVFLVTFSLAQPVVLLLYGQEYASSGTIMSILALGMYVNAVMGFNKDTLRVYHRLRYLFFVDAAIMVITLALSMLAIPEYGALGAAVVFTTALIINNILFHIGLSRLTPVKLFDWSYLRIYVMVVIGATALSVVQAVWSPPLPVGLVLAAALSLLLLRLNASSLQIGETFPELLKVPALGRLLQ
jgi:O-antigen/teichoic acid export membrane protein